jgi:hypothetical protein
MLAAFATPAAAGPAVIGPLPALIGTTSIAELPPAAGRGAERPAQEIVHRRRDGSPTSLPRIATPAALPAMAGPNAFPAVAAASGKKIRGFTGITDGTSRDASGRDVEPPDQGLAVANGVIFEITNRTLQIFSRDGSPLTDAIANARFFAIGAGFSLADPHVLYDPSSARWFVSELLFGQGFNGFAVAVSQTSDPTGRFFIYRFPAASSDVAACGTTGCSPDFPQVGLDQNAYFIAVNLFAGTNAFVTSGLYIFSKAQLLAGTATMSLSRFILDDFTVQPSVPAAGQGFVADDGGTEYLMTAREPQDGSHNLRVYAVTNTSQIDGAPASLRLMSVDVAAQPYRAPVPSSEPDVVGPFCRSRGVTSAPKLDGGFDSFGSNVVLANGNLYAALATAARDGNGLPRDVIAWFAVRPRLTATTLAATIAAQDYIVPPDGFSLSYPEFALDNTGAGIIGMTMAGIDKSARGGFPSAALVEFADGQANQRIRVVGKGAAADDGITGCRRAGAGGIGRWGDYGAGTVDPTTGFFYVANEFIPDPQKFPPGKNANWGTFITRVR